MPWFQNIFAKPRKQASLGKVARRSFSASFAFHGLLLVGAGVFVISHVFFNRESTFTGQPLPTKTYEPRKVELKVKVSRQQRSSSRPSMASRLVAACASAHLSLPEITFDSKLVTTTFQPKVKAVTGRGLGVGLGGGWGTSGFDEGVSSFKIFDIQAKGERIAILVDVSVSMVEPEKGGVAGYRHVKERVGEVIDALKDGTLFNLVVFADACSALEPKMVFASPEMRKKAKTFLQGFNSEGNLGLDSGNFQGSAAGLQAAGGTTRLDLALTAAMQDGADTILIISDGLPDVKKIVDASAVQAHANLESAWRQQNAGAIAAYQQQAATYQQAVAAAPAQQVWVPPTPARPPSAAPLREGAHADPGAPAQPGHWITVHNFAGGGGGAPAAPQAPPMPPPGNWKLADFIQHITLIYESVYKPKSLNPPQISCIGYQIDKDGGAFLNQLSATYKGQYRLVRKVK